MESIVTRDPVEVLRLRSSVRTIADYQGTAVADAFQALEAKLPSIKGRKFYGVSSRGPSGEQYHACVEREPGEDPGRMGLEAGTIDRGAYARRKIDDWPSVVARGGLGPIIQEMMRTQPVDPSRPMVEFYRSRTELHLLIPVLSTFSGDGSR